MMLHKPIGYIINMTTTHVYHLLKRFMYATTMACATHTQAYREGLPETLAEGKIRNAAEVRKERRVHGQVHPELRSGSRHQI